VWKLIGAPMVCRMKTCHSGHLFAAAAKKLRRLAEKLLVATAVVGNNA